MDDENETFGPFAPWVSDISAYMPSPKEECPDAKPQNMSKREKHRAYNRAWHHRNRAQRNAQARAYRLRKKHQGALDV